MFRPLATALCLSFAALPALAQSTTILSPCLDGTTAPALADLSQSLAGVWQMQAAGMGMTMGTNVMPVTLSADPATGALMIGGQGQATVLNVLQVSRDAQGVETNDAPFALTTEDLSAASLTPDEVAVLTGCDNPLRVWWQMGAGTQRSWGALMFYANDRASGFMANSAGGMRRVALSR